MRLIFSLLSVLIGCSAVAQVNLDERIKVDANDEYVFKSLTDPTVAYFMPKGLNRLSDVKIVTVGDRIKLQFDIGIPQSKFDKIQGLLNSAGHPEMKAMLARGVEAAFDPKGGTSLDESFKPIVSPGGDPNDIVGPIPYSLSVRNKGPRGPKNRTALMLKAMFGKGNLDNIATVTVFFPALSMGVPWRGHYTLSVFARTTDVAPELVIPPKGLKSGFAFVSQFMPNLNPEPEIKIVYDHETPCWELHTPGVICLK